MLLNYEIRQTSGAHIDGAPVDPGDINACFNWDQCPPGISRDTVSFDPILTVHAIGNPEECTTFAAANNGSITWDCENR